MAAMVSTLQGEWIKVEQKGGKAPGPRSAHAMAVVGDKLYVFGGELIANKHIDKDLYVFDFNTHTWSIAPPNGNAPPVSVLGVRMVAVGTKLYVYGGRDENKIFSDFYSYDTVKKEWKLLTTLGEVNEPPEARTFHSMTSDENHVYIFGGVSKKSGTMSTPERFRTIDAYNIADDKWVKLPDPGENFEKRGGAGFAAVQGKLWVVYGFASAIAPGPGVKDNYESDAVQYFDTDSGKWVEVKTTGAKPSPRSVFAHAVVGKYIIIYGGEIYPDPLGHLQPGKLSNQGYVLDTETLVWENLAESLKPTLPIGWSAYATATVLGKKGLLMHGGKLLTNERTDDLYFYAVKSA